MMSSPGQSRKKVRRTRATELIERLPQRYQDFVDGTLSVEELDDEELLRCQIKTEQGVFSKNVAVLPAVFVDKVHREYIRRIRQNHLPAVDESYRGLRDIIKAPGASAVAKVNAAALLLDRFEGKVTEKVEHKVEIKAKWEEALSGATVVYDLEETEDMADVVDGEVVEDPLA
jgi:hypothetical protein